MRVGSDNWGVRLSCLAPTVVYLCEDRRNGVRAVTPIGSFSGSPCLADADAPLDVTLCRARDALHTALAAMARPECRHLDWLGGVRLDGVGRTVVVATCVRCT